MLGRFRVDNINDIENVPVCAHYCNAWFEACQNDSTCVESWLDELNFTSYMSNSCPANSECRSFREVYESGEGLCNRMWGNAYTYSTNMENCTVMTFDNSKPNPNFKLTFPSDSMSTASPTLLNVHGYVLLMFFLIAAT